MKLTTKTGIELIRAGENEIQIEKVLLSVFGAERKEQLTLSEIHQMNELFWSIAAICNLLKTSTMLSCNLT